jgi:hypothetical protein
VYSGMALSDTFYSVRRESHMGVYRIRSGSVGRPFTKGNPGGGRPKGAQNKATLEIKEFARNFLMSDRYQRTLERRILAGTAPHTWGYSSTTTRSANRRISTSRRRRPPRQKPS